MTHFIDPEDYDATVHRDIIDSLTRGDDSILDICEDRAIEEMKSYLSPRYDVEALFSARAGERHPLVLMMCLDIATYHIYCVGNPQKLQNGIRKDRYDRATEWLRAVSKGTVSVNGAPLLEEDLREQAFFYRGNPKRAVHL
jgi:phage gp36-like protein